MASYRVVYVSQFLFTAYPYAVGAVCMIISANTDLQNGSKSVPYEVEENLLTIMITLFTYKTVALHFNGLKSIQLYSTGVTGHPR